MHNKRGVSGVELIVSFVIFISFLTFIFSYMSPLSMPASRSVLTTLESAVSDNATVEIETTPFAVNETLLEQKNAACFKLSGESLTDVFITDNSGNEIAFQSGTGNVEYTHEKFYYINKAAGITGKQKNLAESNCVPLTRNKDYSTSIVRTKKVYYNTSLEELKNAYSSNYAGLKANLKIPANSDFSIIIFDSNQKEIISMAKPLPQMNIISKEFPIEILSDGNGITISKGFMRLLVW